MIYVNFIVYKAAPLVLVVWEKGILNSLSVCIENTNKNPILIFVYTYYIYLRNAMLFFFIKIYYYCYRSNAILMDEPR